MNFRGINIIINNNSKSASPWMMPFGILPQLKFFLLLSIQLPSYMASVMNHMTLSDYLYIFGQSIQLCQTISLVSCNQSTLWLHFRLALISWKICWSIHRKSPVPLVLGVSFLFFRKHSVAYEGVIYLHLIWTVTIF